METSGLVKKLQELAVASPQAPVNLIVRVSIPPEEAALLLARGNVKVLRKFRLIPALAIQGYPADCLKLASESWVDSMEEDREVKAL